MQDVERNCMSCIILAIGLFAVVSCQIFDRKPTIYDHMKSGANTIKSNLIESELKIDKLYTPAECVIDVEDFYGDKGAEIAAARERLRLITAEEGDTVTLHYKVVLEDGTVLDNSRKDSEELGGEAIETPAVFAIGYGHVIPGWEIGLQDMCIGEIRKITIPPQLAYGTKGYKKKNIPPDATLEIETELVSLKKKDMVDHYMDFLQNLHVYAFFILGLTFLLSGYYKGQIGDKRRMYREIAERKQRIEMERKGEADKEIEIDEREQSDCEAEKEDFEIDEYEQSDCEAEEDIEVDERERSETDADNHGSGDDETYDKDDTKDREADEKDQ